MSTDTPTPVQSAEQANQLLRDQAAILIAKVNDLTTQVNTVAHNAEPEINAVNAEIARLAVLLVPDPVP